MPSHAKPKQTELQFVDLSTLDNRNKVREVSKAREERLHWIDLDIIRIRPGQTRATFNWRLQKNGEDNEAYEKRIGIPELADAILKSNGPDDPIRGDFKDGLFYITGGERRFRAIRYIATVLGVAEYSNGTPTSLVEVYQNPKWFNDSDRRRVIFTSQNQLRYSPLELAYGFLDIKNAEQKTNEQIADDLKVSRQTVDNYILLTTLPEETQKEVDEGRLPISTALAHYRQEKKKEKDAKRVENEIPERPTWRKDEQKKEDEADDQDIPPQKDNTVSKPASKLKESSGEVIYKESQEALWGRVITMAVSLVEQGKSPEYVIGELKANFTIQKLK